MMFYLFSRHSVTIPNTKKKDRQMGFFLYCTPYWIEDTEQGECTLLELRYGRIKALISGLFTPPLNSLDWLVRVAT